MGDEEEYEHKEKLCNFNITIFETWITDSQEEIEGFINNQKSVNATKEDNDWHKHYFPLHEKKKNKQNKTNKQTNKWTK